MLAFVLIGLGVGAAGTSLLVLLAKRADDDRRAGGGDHRLGDDDRRLRRHRRRWPAICSIRSRRRGWSRFPGAVSLSRLSCVTLAGVWGVEGQGGSRGRRDRRSRRAKPHSARRWREVWTEPEARRFTIFVFVSMLAYSAQDLILEPFAGMVFGFTPGEIDEAVRHAAWRRAGRHDAGRAGRRRIGGARLGSLRIWTIGGCIASALALAAASRAAAFVGPAWPLRGTCLRARRHQRRLRGGGDRLDDGAGGSGRETREGVRMGLWGAAQAIAFGIGGFLGTRRQRHRALAAGVAGTVLRRRLCV